MIWHKSFLELSSYLSVVQSMDFDFAVFFPESQT